MNHNTTGNNNIAIGQIAGVRITTGSNNIDIGSQGAAPDESRTIRIGKKTAQRNTYIAGISGVSIAAALGALAGALLANYFTGNLLASQLRYLLWDFCAPDFAWKKVRIAMPASRSAIIVLIPRSNAAWIIALHRFFEVSVAIDVTLAPLAAFVSHNSLTSVAGRTTQIREERPSKLSDCRSHAIRKLRNRHGPRILKFVSRREQRADLQARVEANSENSSGCRIAARISRLSTMRGPGRAK